MVRRTPERASNRSPITIPTCSSTTEIVGVCRSLRFASASDAGGESSGDPLSSTGDTFGYLLIPPPRLTGIPHSSVCRQPNRRRRRLANAWRKARATPQARPVAGYTFSSHRSLTASTLRLARTSHCLALTPPQLRRQPVTHTSTLPGIQD